MSFLSGLFGGNQVQAPQVSVSPTSGYGGGLNMGYNRAQNNYTVTPTADRTAAVSGVASTFGQQATDIAGLRSQFTPGFSNMRQSIMTALQNNRMQSLGNLRDNLAQRRVLGSSFAQNSLANADQTYQQQIQQAQAESFLQELSVQQQLSQQQFAAARGQFQTGLDELNLEAGVTQQLVGQATQAMTQAATTQAQLDLNASIANQKQNQDNLAGFGKLLGTVGGSLIGGPLGGMIGGAAFGGGSIFSGDAYGGSSSNPLPGLSASDYGVGY